MIRPTRPTIGFALSGASTRALFYIGFLEVMQEQNIPIDYIAACSSGAIVAAAYACGTLAELKKDAMLLDRGMVFELAGKREGKGGLYNLDKVEEIFNYYTRGLSFEQVRPLMGFVATDIEQGEQIVLSMGDIAHAMRITCTVPGLFSPVKWGERTLVDGGLLNIIPIDVVKQANMDVVVGVDLSGAKFMFTPGQVYIKKIINLVKKVLLLNQAGKIWHEALAVIERTDVFSYFREAKDLGIETAPKRLFSILGRSLDLIIEAERKKDTTLSAQADLMIVPDIPKLHLKGLDHKHQYYEAGRQVARDYIPQIQALLEQNVVVEPELIRA